MKIFKILIIVVIIAAFLVTSYAAGCHNPLIAKTVHNKVKVGMSIDEVLNIISRYKGQHSYLIKLIDEKAKKECSKLKLEFEECLKDNYHITCLNKVPAYEKCEKRMLRLEEFTNLMNQVINKKIDYVDFEAKISVLFMGPVFLHNSFEINLSPDGKVKSITSVEHWD